MYTDDAQFATLSLWSWKVQILQLKTFSSLIAVYTQHVQLTVYCYISS